MKLLSNKIFSLFLILLIYGLTFTSMYFIFNLLNMNILLKLLIVDVIGTIIIFIFSNIFKNSSCYDPYWSVMPPYLIFLYIIGNNVSLNTQSIFILILVGLWSIRLTINWIISFKNLKVEDFRYQELRKKKLFFLINLFGIHLVHTILVYLGTLPVYYYLNSCLSTNVNLSTFIALTIGLVGVFFELFSDLSMKEFKKNSKNPLEVCESGLWKYSRHPNYLGELMFWWSLFLMMLSIDDNSWILILGPILMVLLFYFISVPMMEARQLKNKAGYKDYMERTNMFLVFPRKKVTK